MDITIHTAFLPHTDPDQSLGFYRDDLEFEVRNGLFGRVQGTDAEVVQEPTDQPYGVRDCAFRDPAGNMVRIQQQG